MTREQVVAAAVALADSAGVEALSMRKLAQLAFASPDELEQVAEAIVALMPADEYPNLREAATELASSGFDYSEQFDVGLDLILDGLHQLRGGGR